MPDNKSYEKPFKFDNDMSMDEVIKRVAAVKKEEIDAVASNEEEGIPYEGECQLTTFGRKEIRKRFHNNEWFLSIVDVIEGITETDRPRQYWNDLKRQLAEKEGFLQLSEDIVQLKMIAEDGKMRDTDAVNVETLFRIIQSIPSPKAEPFKRWLAKVGYERIQEFQDPEIAVKRAIVNWQIQGRTNEWIEARLRSIVVRHELTDEWAKRGVTEGMEYGYLTNRISKKTWGIKTKDHSKLKGLTSQNLRDHMTDFELVLTMLGEKSTAAIAQERDAHGLDENAVAADAGGQIAGDTRKSLEKQLGRPILSKENFLKKKPETKQIPKKKG